MEKGDKNMKTENTKQKIRTGLTRRQNSIFVAMVTVGMLLVILSQLIDVRLLSEGIAFIIVGFVGMLMWWTTSDVGASIKEEIRKVGRENEASLNEIKKTTRGMSSSLDKMSSSLDEIKNTNRGIATSLDEIKNTNRGMSSSLDKMSTSLDEIKKILQNNTTKS